MDVIIPIVFPDYKISVHVPKAYIDVFPYVEWDNFTISSFKSKFSNLGHAGVLFINGKTGETKYFEYGRYDSSGFGIVRKIRSLPNAVIKEGVLEYSSLKKALRKISKVSGQSGSIKGVYIEVGNKFSSMLDYARLRKSQNSNKKRKPYDLINNSCIHFVKELAIKAGVKTPWMADPRPNSYIGEFRDDYIDLDYSRNNLVLEGIGKF